MARCSKAFVRRFTLAASALALLTLTGCVARSMTPSAESLAVGASPPLTGPQSLALSLQDQTGAPVAGATVTWRPVFNPPDQGVTGESDAAGGLRLTALWPGVRYVIQVLTPSGERFQRTYTPSAYAQWQWRLIGALPSETPTRAAVERLVVLSADPVDALSQILPAFAPLWQSTAASLTVSTASTPSAIAALNTAEVDRTLVWWMGNHSPQALAACPESCVSALVDYVRAGGTLLVSGEWAGLGADPEQLTDRLGQALGFVVGRDTLAQPQSRLHVRNLHGHVLTEGVQQLFLQRSSSVVPDALAQAQELAFASEEHYQILQADNPTPLKLQATVLAVLSQGKGQVIVLGDTSLWSGETLCAGDNLRLWQNILRGSAAVAGKSLPSPCDNTVSLQGAVQDTL